MQTDIQLKKFLLSDLDRVLEIEKSSFPLGAYSKKRLANFNKKQPGEFVVAHLSNRPVGYIIAHNKGNKLELDSMAVDKDYRGLGIGCLLIDSIINKFKDKKAFLEVRTNNKEAITLYKKFGFKIVKTLKRYYRDEANAFLMEKDCFNS